MKNSLGVEVPAGSDAFDPQVDMGELGDSLRSRIIVPVANATERDALAAAKPPSTAAPLFVHRADAPDGFRVESCTDAAGQVWQAHPGLVDGKIPHLSIRRSMVQARAAGAWGVVVFDQKADEGGAQPWTWTPGGPIVLTEAGMFSIETTICMSIATFAVQIVAGGKVRGQSSVGVAGSLVANSTSALVRLAAGDGITVNVYPSAAANVLADATQSPAFLSITRLSA